MLYVVATPIGNLEDMTPRAIRILNEADIIAAEDTRHSRVLLAFFNIKKTPIYSCHKFNEGSKGDFFISKLKEGKTIALISDAGTPCISDPGHLLVNMAAKAGFPVVAVCGASAVVAALSVSGFEVNGFQFLGFLPRKKREIAEILKNALPNTIVFYESPKRIIETLKIIAENFEEAQICLCNDITKKFEKSYRGTTHEVIEELEENPNAEKGEYTCVVSVAKTTSEAIDDITENTPSLESQLVDIMIKTGGNLKDAAAELREKHKLPKREVYNAMLRLKDLL